MFAYAIRKAIGALAAAAGGVDMLVFTGDIGQHAPRIRAEACEGLAFLGVELDPERNARASGTEDERVSADASRCAVHVIPTNEELVIARHVLEVARQAVAFSDSRRSARSRRRRSSMIAG